jgi:hypothetical protein
MCTFYWDSEMTNALVSISINASKRRRTISLIVLWTRFMCCTFFVMIMNSSMIHYIDHQHNCWLIAIASNKFLVFKSIHFCLTKFLHSSTFIVFKGINLFFHEKWKFRHVNFTLSYVVSLICWDLPYYNWIAQKMMFFHKN